MIFDCETTGLPLNFHAPITDLFNWPRITDLAWELCWENGETIQQMSEIISPDG